MYCTLTGWCKLSNWFKAKTVKKERFDWCNQYSSTYGNHFIFSITNSSVNSSSSMYLYNTVRDTFLQRIVAFFLQTTDSNFLKSLYDFPARPWEIFRIRQDPAATYNSLEVNSRKKTVQFEGCTLS